MSAVDCRPDPFVLAGREKGDDGVCRLLEVRLLSEDELLQRGKRLSVEGIGRKFLVCGGEKVLWGECMSLSSFLE
jgi:hypothetical protein